MKALVLNLLILSAGICPLVAQQSVCTLNGKNSPKSNFEVSAGNAITGDSDVFNGGGRYNAVSFGNETDESGKDVTVNGVSFYIIPSDTGNLTWKKDGISISQACGLKRFPTSSDQPPFSELSPGYRSILGFSTARILANEESGDKNPTKYYTVSGLLSDRKYRIQIWCNDSRAPQEGEAKSARRTWMGGFESSCPFKYEDGSTDRIYAYSNRTPMPIGGELGSYFDGILQDVVDGKFGFTTGGIVNAINVQELP